MKILFGELMGVFESQSGYKVTVVHVTGEGKILWSGPKVIVMVSFGRKNLMQHMLCYPWRNCFCVSTGINSASRQGCICQIFTGGQSFDWRLATIADMEVAKLVPWNSLLNQITSVSIEA